MRSLTHLNVRNNALVELKFENTTNLQTLDCSNNSNLATNGLSLPNHFNPASLDCRNTSLGRIHFFNSSVFDCQTGNFVEKASPFIPPSPTPPLENGNELSNSDKIALGTGIGLGVPGLALTAFGV